MTESVRELTAAIASGDAEAFARFYRQWFDVALREAHRCTGRDEQFCLDAVQEAMLRVIRRMKPLDGEPALLAWLRTAVRSACVDLLRSEARRSRREHLFSRDQHEAQRHAADLEREQTLAWLRQELAKVDSISAEALHRRFRLNLTLVRIGSALGLKPGAVDGRLSRSLARLRASARDHSHD